MRSLKHSIDRLKAVVFEIEKLEQSEFPYTHSSEALAKVKPVFERRLATLKGISDKLEKHPDVNLDVVNNLCAESLNQLYYYLPILGFILRSTNVRTAFEIHGSLLRLARRILGTTTRLLVSSEWEYSPIVYRAIVDLPDFVLIGLPACESSNPFIVPLTGHELGHSAWQKERLREWSEPKLTIEIIRLVSQRRDRYREFFPVVKIEDISADFLARTTWQPALTWALLQVEEVFCDALGLGLFGESYYHAFAYLMAPRAAGQRSPHYPALRQRATYLVQAAETFKLKLPDDAVDQFESEDRISDPLTNFMIEITDKATEAIVPGVMQRAQDLCERQGVPKRSNERIEHICQQLKMVAPISQNESLVDVLNAGWDCWLKDDLKSGPSPIEEPEKREWVLKELILKSIEIIEVKERVKDL